MKCAVDIYQNLYPQKEEQQILDQDINVPNDEAQHADLEPPTSFAKKIASVLKKKSEKAATKMEPQPAPPKDAIITLKVIFFLQTFKYPFSIPYTRVYHRRN